MKFDEKELEIIGEYNMPGIYGAPDSIVPKYNRPITPKKKHAPHAGRQDASVGAKPDP